jgi:hypothetical protein
MTDFFHDPYAGHGPGRFTDIEDPAEQGAGYAQDHAGNLAPSGEPRPYAADQVFAVLKALGYSASQADLAMNRAMSRDSWPLSRHVVRYDGGAGTYALTPRRAS